MLERHLHPDLRNRQDLFSVRNELMEANIGRKIRVKNWHSGMGTACRDHEFRIIGIQNLHDGSVGYRALCLGYNDTFGTPFRPSEIKFVEE